ncbi:uncharacterized protein LOC112046439 isoform X1 [Bicyclus anynana]|uniref:Uncharacterized protein LOC112046439 isoform X1 n=1 Tax=Bicyclus anynana TaxID=110368 RepID=A0A6J1N0Z8_BICAN|nr:uncharacterized protein LOC112046439 isoform X1 [Bicyclus anynana]
MSSKSCTSGSVRSGAGSVRLGQGSVRLGPGSVRLGPGAAHEVVLDALYERKRDKKTVRVLTVIVYVFCVSLAAIMLSLYYVFFWEPKDAHYAQRKVSNTVTPQTSTTPMPTCFLPHTGGSDTPVNDTATPPTLDNIVNFTSSNDTALPTLDYLDDSTSVAPQDTTVDGEVDVTTVT